MLEAPSRHTSHFPLCLINAALRRSSISNISPNISPAENSQRAICDPALTSSLISCVLWPREAAQTRAETLPTTLTSWCPPPRSTRAASCPFTREPADPLTPTGAQDDVGTETQRIMGSEVREERHQGCVVRSLVLSFGLLPPH